MDAKSIIRLLDAGYTKEEISAMETVPVQTPAVETPAPTPAPAPVQIPVVNGNPDPYPVPAEAPVAVAVAEPAPQPTPVPAQEQAQPSMTDVMREIARLTSAVQANAIASSSMPVQTGTNLDNVMANIIKPTRGNQNG